jgi:hypothetical protein
VQASRDVPPCSPRNVPLAQGVTALAPTPHQPPASHGSHAVEFHDDWYSPAAHATHTLSPLLSANRPGEHLTGCSDPARQKLPSGHETHDGCPGDGWYVPA